MTIENEFKLLVSGYYGVCEMDEYELKIYILKKIENYIRDYINEYPLPNKNYQEIIQEVEKKSLKEKLQDSLLVLNRLETPLELTLLIRNRLNNLRK